MELSTQLCDDGVKTRRSAGQPTSPMTPPAAAQDRGKQAEYTFHHSAGAARLSAPAPLLLDTCLGAAALVITD